MHDIRKINVVEGIMEANDHIAEHIKDDMEKRGFLLINEMGSPGVGKTTALKNIIKNMEEIEKEEKIEMKPYVIEGDIESNIDAMELEEMGVKTVQINTFGACHLDAPMIDKAIKDINPEKKGIMFIENIGNLVCPAEFSIGEHIKMLISTVTEGSDKPYKYPVAFENADVIVMNRIDLTQYVDFDEAFYMKGLRALNKEAPVFKVSGKTGEGFKELTEWLVGKYKEISKK